jgi:hypothetical protein
MLFALKSPLLLYPFRFFDPVRKRWIRARYVAERHAIESSYAQCEIIGPPEIRLRGDPARDSFNPFRGPAAHLPPDEETPPDHGPMPDPPPAEEPPPIEDELERFLLLLFLRRYVTWCARSRRFAQMNGAVLLYRISAGHAGRLTGQRVHY